MKKIVKKMLREHCPNIPIIRKKLNEAKLREVHKYVIAPKEVQAGEQSDKKQKQVVGQYRKKWPKYYRNLDEKFDEYARRCSYIGNRSDLEELRTKVLFTCMAYGFMPDEFFAYELEHKKPEEIASYISDRERFALAYRLNDFVDLNIYFDKYLTYEKFRRYYKREAVCVEKASDYLAFQSFVEKHPIFVKKNVYLSRGDSVELVDTSSCGKTNKEIFDGMTDAGKHIVEEKVVQSQVMAALNPFSVNTIRCITFGTKEGIKIGPCFLKTGQGGSFVDNGAKGGILVGIDHVTGQLETIGKDEFLTKYPTHPDTGISFVGYQLPDWEHMQKLVTEMSAQTPTVRYVGWDMAHTDQGWVVVEGNGCGQFIGPQIVWKRGFKEDINTILS